MSVTRKGVESDRSNTKIMEDIFKHTLTNTDILIPEGPQRRLELLDFIDVVSGKGTKGPCPFVRPNKPSVIAFFQHVDRVTFHKF